jgi:hypothetical protein
VAEVADSGNPPLRQRLITGLATLCEPDSFNQVDILIPIFPPRIKRGEPYQLRIGLSNASGRDYRLGLSAGALPPGLALGEGNLPGLCVISGTPTESGLFECFLRATDGAGAFGLRRILISVE